jgi:imidazolonepropionase-like amidohydrolase
MVRSLRVLTLSTLGLWPSVLLIPAAPSASSVPPPAERVMALVNATVVDVRSGRVLPRQTLVVRGARVETANGAAAPDGARAIDVGGRYVSPGLIDAHAHITTVHAMRTALESGVTTVRSSGVSSYVDVGMRELVRKGAVAGPEVLASGYHVRPQLAEEAFRSSPDLAPFMRPPGVTTPEAIRRVVRENLLRGVDWIKVLATEHAGLPDTDPRKQVYNEEQLRAAVLEAASRDIPVQAHAHGDEGAMAAVRAGVRSVEHGTYLSDATLALMQRRGVYLDPTYTTVVDLVEPGGDYDAPALRLRGRHMLPRLRDTVQRAHRLGVRIVTGADTGYGASSRTRIAHEVASFVELGMTPVQALQAATIVPAGMLRIEARTGSLDAGMEADLIVTERNPLEDPRALQDVLLVMADGRLAVNRLEMENEDR